MAKKSFWRRSHTQAKTRNQKPKYRPHLETLEDRVTPATYLGFNDSGFPVFFFLNQNVNNGTFSATSQFNKQLTTLGNQFPLPSGQGFITADLPLASDVPVVDSKFIDQRTFNAHLTPSTIVVLNSQVGTFSPDFRSLDYTFNVIDFFTSQQVYQETVQLELVGKGDVQVKDFSQPDSEFIGQNIYSPSGPGSQILTRDIQPGQRLFFTIRTENDFPLDGFPENYIRPGTSPLAFYREPITGSGPEGWLLRAGTPGQNPNGFPLDPNQGAAFFPNSNQFFDHPIFVQAPFNAQPGDTFVVTAQMTRERADNGEVPVLAGEVFDTIQIVLRVPVQQDLQVRRDFEGENFVGANITEADPSELQTVQLPALPNSNLQFEVQFVNNDAPQAFNLRAQETGNDSATDRYQVKYFHNGTDVTAQIVAGTFVTPTLGTGQAFKLQVQIRAPGNLAGNANRIVVIRAFRDTLTTTPLDAVRIVASTELIVNTNRDVEDNNFNDGVDSDPTTPGLQLSLRDAIKIANQIPGHQTIKFAIPDDPTIVVATPLPVITDNVTIDGTTQPGGLVEITADQNPENPDGLQAANDAHTDGLKVTNSATIQGLFIDGFEGAGINVAIEGSIDVRRTKTIVITHNILGNNGRGLELTDANYQILDNLIGINEDNEVIPNEIGILLKLFTPTGINVPLFLSPNIVIGDDDNGNVISGNRAIGVFVGYELPLFLADPPERSNPVVISNNSIGLDLGDNPVGGHVVAGVYINASDVSVSNNVLSGNDGDGLIVSDFCPIDDLGQLPLTVQNVIIQGNDIGSIPDGGTAGNENGVRIVRGLGQTRNVIVGEEEDQEDGGNQISGNRLDGIHTKIADVLIKGNGIFDNGRHGIFAEEARDEVFGGLRSHNGIGFIQGNNILNNGEAGVFAQGDPLQQAFFVIGHFPFGFPGIIENPPLIGGANNNIIGNRTGVVAGKQALVFGNLIVNNDLLGITTAAFFDAPNGSGSFSVTAPQVVRVDRSGDKMLVRFRLRFPVAVDPSISSLVLQFYENDSLESALDHGALMFHLSRLSIPAVEAGDTREFTVAVPLEDALFDFFTMTASVIGEAVDRESIANIVYTSPFSQPFQLNAGGGDLDSDNDGVSDILEVESANANGFDNGGVPFQFDATAVAVPVTRSNGLIDFDNALAMFERNDRPFRNVASVPVDFQRQFPSIPDTIALPRSVRDAQAVSFEVELEQPGDAADVLFQLPIEFLTKRIVKLMPDGSFRDITNDPNVGIANGTVRFTIIDGGPFDGDLLINGRVKDPIIFADVNDTDLALAVTGPASLLPEQNAVFNFTIANVGQQLAALPRAVSDPLPANLTFVNASDGGVFDPTTRRVTWALDGELEAGRTKNFSLTVRPTATGPLSFAVVIQQNPFLIDTVNGNDAVTINANVVDPRGDVTIVQTGKELRIIGDGAANDVTLVLNNGRVEVASQNSNLNGSATPLVFTGITRLFVDLGAGDDTLTVTGSLGRTATVTFNGGTGTDRLVSNANVNQTLTDTRLVAAQTFTLTGFELASLRGGAGNNRLDASKFSGAVVLDGGAGNDTLIGGAGNDILIGGPGIDTVIQVVDADVELTNNLLTGRGNDLLDGIERVQLTGGRGNNIYRLLGFTGQATINGGAGRDILVADDDTDMVLTNALLTTAKGARVNLASIEAAELIGGASDNRLNASATSRPVVLRGLGGNDILTGGSGNDLILGGDGDDTLVGGRGNDTLRGEAGNDRLDGGPGRNVLEGGEGQDGIVVNGTHGMDVIRIQRQANNMVRIEVNGQVTFSQYFGETIFVFGGTGNDYIQMLPGEGNAWKAEFHGGDGNDTLIGLSGDDVLDGGPGRNAIFIDDGVTPLPKPPKKQLGNDPTSMAFLEYLLRTSGRTAPWFWSMAGVA
jgi:Ca2+-binding RTX toxin-like protein